MTRKSEITFGDLVHIDGYDTRCFFVDGWTIEHNYTPDEVWTERWYDVTCAHTGEYHMAEASEVTRVCGADQADDYLIQYATPPEISNVDIYDIFSIGEALNFGLPKREESKMKKQPTQRELSSMEAERRKKARKERKEKIDDLLDIRNWNAEMYEKTSERAYRVKIEEIDAELTELAEEGRR